MTPSTIVAVVLSLAAARSGFQEAHPRRELNPALAHIVVFPPSHWDIRLYGNPGLSGPAVLHLNDEGLSADGKLACSWPGGRWQESREANMVLGYRSVDATGYQGCTPADLPIISTWGDRGLGSAALYIEVVSRRGHIIETRWAARRLYFDLNSLPGDPRVSVPNAQLERKGFVGWEWLLSEREEARRTRVAFARLLREPGFKRFLQGARSCLSSSRVARCFAAFVKSPFYHSGAATALGKSNYVTPAEFVRYAWTAPGESGGSGKMWDDLCSCLTVGVPVAATSTKVQFSGTVLCNVELGRTGWALTAFYVDE